MSTDALAAFEALLSKPAIKVNGIYWRQVRLGFYRPLTQFKEYPLGTIVLPSLAALGAAQYAVPIGTAANSTLNCLFFQKTSEYSIQSLVQSLRRQVRIASKQFSIKRITDIGEFKTHGFRAYISFQKRTGYEFGSRRLDPQCFSEWAEKLFQNSSVLVLGGYQNGILTGVSLSYLFDDVVHYKTFFCTTESMQYHLSGYMLHAVRTAAAAQPQVNQIFAGMHKGNDGLDGFYMLRGAECIRKPAYLRINSLLKPFIKYGMPRMHSRMTGNDIAVKT